MIQPVPRLVANTESARGKIKLWRCAATWALLAATAPAAPARADGLALDRLRPAPAGDRFLGVPSPYVAGSLDVHAMLLFEYAYNPLVLRPAGGGDEIATLVAHQAVVHANVTLALANRVLVNVDVPAISIQTGSADPTLHFVDFGDLRVGARVRLYGDDGTPFQLGLGTDVWIPTGTGAYVTDGKLRALPYLVAGGLGGPVLWTLAVGPELRRSQLFRDKVQEGTSLDLGAGVAVLLGDKQEWQVGLESEASFVLSSPSPSNLDVELLAHGRYRFLNRFEIGVGVGPGLSTGIGTPTVRALGFFAYIPVAHLTPPPPPPEGGVDPADLPFDRQARVIHVEPGASTQTPSDASSPQDGASAKPKGGTTSSVPPSDQAELVGDEIALGDDVYFASGSATIEPRSEGLIHSIAQLLLTHPEIRKVEVRGHTDFEGTLPANERLAERRAESVRQALIRHSIDPARLTAKGYGPGTPAVSNVTASGRARNRRVEIRILERAPAGK